MTTIKTQIMLNPKNILTITKKELRSYFNSPTAYVILVIFLLLWEFLFFRDVFLVGEASLRILFNLLPWLMLILIPAITMGSISQEKSEGTLELLLTHPLKEIELLVGKFLGSLGFVAAALLFIFPIAASFSKFGNLDWGVATGQYLASFLLAAVFISLGIFISSLFESQISSLLLTAAVIFILIVVGLNLITAIIPLFLTRVLEQLSALTHFESMSRGVIDLRDLWYFLSATIIFLSLAYLQLLKRKFGNRRSLYRSYQTGISLFVGIAILTNIVGSRIPGRIDLTQNRLYTLTEVTNRTLNELNDVVNITLFASDELPAQLQPVLRDTKDILRDYETLGKGNITVFYKDPNADSEAAQEAQSLGVREMQFNVVGREEFQVKTGYLGLAVSYGGENESIPFIENTTDLEYQLTSFIKKLTTAEKKKIAFLSGHGEKGLHSDYRLLGEELGKQFEVEEALVDEESEEEKAVIPENTSVLVVAGPDQKIEEGTRVAIKEFLDSGGAALFMIDAVTVNPQMMSATANPESFADFLKDYGAEVRQDLVYDLRSNETLQFGGGMINYLLPYPLWARVVPVDQGSPITSKIESLILPWGSSISFDEEVLSEKSLRATRLLSTTKFGGRQKNAFTITPDQKFSQEGLNEQLVAASITDEDSPMRMVVIGDSDLLTDQFVQNSPENLAFGIGMLSWLGQEESLASIQIKQRGGRNLMFENETQVALVKYGNMALAILAPTALGIFRLMRRKNLRKLAYG